MYYTKVSCVFILCWLVCFVSRLPVQRTYLLGAIAMCIWQALSVLLTSMLTDMCACYMLSWMLSQVAHSAIKVWHCRFYWWRLLLLFCNTKLALQPGAMCFWKWIHVIHSTSIPMCRFQYHASKHCEQLIYDGTIMHQVTWDHYWGHRFVPIIKPWSAIWHCHANLS